VLDREPGATQRLPVAGEFVEIVVDSHCRTGVRGVFAAGDCTDVHDKRIVISVGEGAKAALGAFEYLVTPV